MQSAFDRVIDDFQALDHQVGRAGRLDLASVALRVVTDLFCVRTDYSPGDVARFETIVHGLIPRENRVALAQAALRIARHPQAPVSLLNRFVSMGGACAQAVLESAAVDDHVLIEIAGDGTPQLAASVARRNDLDAATCTLLAGRGERLIDLALASNEAARCAPAAIARLAGRAVADRELAELVLERWGPEQFPHLFLNASPAQRGHMILSLRRQAVALPAPPVRTATTAQRASLTAAGLSGDGGKLAVELAGAAALDPTVALRIVDDPHGDPLAVALTALGFLPEEAVPVLLFANPAFGTSVETVRRLASICRTLPQAVAADILGQMAGRRQAATRQGAGSSQMLRERPAASAPVRLPARPGTDASRPKVA